MKILVDLNISKRAWVIVVLAPDLQHFVTTFGCSSVNPCKIKNLSHYFSARILL